MFQITSGGVNVNASDRNETTDFHAQKLDSSACVVAVSCLGRGIVERRAGSGGRVVKRRTVNRGDGGSIPPTAVSKLRQFRSPHICLCLSEETLQAGGPFYLVSMPGEIKDLTQGCVTFTGLTNYRWTLNALQRAQSSICEKERKRERKICWVDK